jgi:hypothetical protein
MSDPLPNVLPPGSPLARRAAVVSCWLCGIRLHQNQMVPDGSSTSPDLRWYCGDTQACTERWVSARRQGPGREVPSPGNHTAVPSIQTANPPAAGPAQNAGG